MTRPDEDPLGAALGAMGAVGLEELDARAALRRRVDRKYLVSVADAARILVELSSTHAVLAIDGGRSFAYDTLYLDSADLRCLRDHLQGRRRRYKCRVRSYGPSGELMLELKWKGSRGETAKDRRRLDTAGRATTDEAMGFLSERLARHYALALPGPLNPVLSVRYLRSTLLAHTAAERVTLDRTLRFGYEEHEVGRMREDMVIIETKSVHGRGTADATLRRHGVRPVNDLSKYCVGMGLAGHARRTSWSRAVRSAFGEGCLEAHAGRAAG